MACIKLNLGKMEMKDERKEAGGEGKDWKIHSQNKGSVGGIMKRKSVMSSFSRLLIYHYQSYHISSYPIQHHVLFLVQVHLPFTNSIL